MSDAGQPFGEDLAQRGWSWATLETIAEVVGGVTKNQRLAQGRDVPYLRVANVQRGHLDLSVVKTILASEAAIAELRLLPGDILLNEGGDRDKLGRGWVWEGQIPECIHQNHVFRARLRNPWISPKFVSYYTNSVGQSYFLGQGKQTTNLASISLSKIRQLPVAVPPAGEQRRIVDEIEKQFTRLDAAVATLKSVQAKLKRARASVLKAAVEGRLVPTEAELARAEGRSYEPASALLERILAERHSRWPKGKKYQPPAEPKTDDLPELPEGWSWATWAQTGTSQNGRPFPSSQYQSAGVRLLRPGNLLASGAVEWNDSNMRRLPHEWATKCPELLLDPGELVMNLTAQSLKDEFLGRICITGPGEPALLNQRLARLTPLLLDRRYVLWLLKSSWFRAFVQALNTGSLIQHMFTSQLDAFILPLPPAAEQARIAAEVERRLSVIDNLEHTVEQNIARCGRLRQSILKRAFEGKLVPQDPSDEPASRLLERIRAATDSTDRSSAKQADGSGRRAAASPRARQRR